MIHLKISDLVHENYKSLTMNAYYIPVLRNKNNLELRLITANQFLRNIHGQEMCKMFRTIINV